MNCKDRHNGKIILSYEQAKPKSTMLNVFDDSEDPEGEPAYCAKEDEVMTKEM